MLEKLFQKDPAKRFGSAGCNEIKNHPWFKSIDWKAMVEKDIKSPYEPQLDSEEDLKYFSQEFTSMKISPEQVQHSSVNN